MRAFDHVGTAGGQETSVAIVVAFGRAETCRRVGRTRRDRRGRRQCEPVPEVVRDLRQVDPQGVRVGRLQAADRRGTPIGELANTLDRLEHRNGLLGADGGGSGPLQRPDDVRRGDLDVVERRGVADPLGEVEGPRQPVVGDSRQRCREVRMQHRTALARRPACVGEQRAGEAAAEELSLLAGLGERSLRIEEARLLDLRGQGSDDADAQRATPQVWRATPGLCGFPFARACPRDERQDQERCRGSPVTHPLHVAPSLAIGGLEASGIEGSRRILASVTGRLQEGLSTPLDPSGIPRRLASLGCGVRGTHAP